MSELFDRLDQKREEFLAYERNWFTNACNNHQLFSISNFVKESFNFPLKAAIAPSLFRKIYPVAEDAAHGIGFDERVHDMFVEFKKCLEPSAIKIQGNKNERIFSFTIGTYVVRGTSAHVTLGGERNTTTSIEMETKKHSMKELVWVHAILGRGDATSDAPVVIFCLHDDGKLTGVDIRHLINS